MKSKVSFLLVFALILISCQSRSQDENKDKEKSLSDLTQPNATYTMPDILEEISGITFVKGDTNLIYAIQDELGVLFTYSLPQQKVVAEFKFADPGDYEGVTTDGKHFFVLRSDGKIYSFPVEGPRDRNRVSVFQDGLGKGEYESISFDQTSNHLYVLCKSCAADKKKKTLTGYALPVDVNSKLGMAKDFTIDVGALSKIDKKIGRTIKPSAMTKRQTTNEWYVLSSIDRFVLVLDEQFNLKEVRRFERKLLQQPEGIVFDERDCLYISSEGNNRKKAAIYYFKSER